LKQEAMKPGTRHVFPWLHGFLPNHACSGCEQIEFLNAGEGSREKGEGENQEI
jgi:hypothetical protein